MQILSFKKQILKIVKFSYRLYVIDIDISSKEDEIPKNAKFKE